MNCMSLIQIKVFKITDQSVPNKTTSPLSFPFPPASRDWLCHTRLHTRTQCVFMQHSSDSTTCQQSRDQTSNNFMISVIRHSLLISRKMRRHDNQQNIRPKVQNTSTQSESSR